MLLRELRALKRGDRLHWRGKDRDTCQLDWRADNVGGRWMWSAQADHAFYVWLGWPVLKGWHLASKCPFKGKRRVKVGRLKK